MESPTVAPIIEIVSIDDCEVSRKKGGVRWVQGCGVELQNPAVNNCPLINSPRTGRIPTQLYQLVIDSTKPTRPELDMGGRSSKSYELDEEEEFEEHGCCGCFAKGVRAFFLVLLAA